MAQKHHPILVILPPLSVYLTQGVGVQLIINIILTLIGFIPGLIHALWLYGKK